MRKSFPLSEKPAVLLWLSIALLLPVTFLLTRWALHHNEDVRADRNPHEAPIVEEPLARAG